MKTIKTEFKCDCCGKIICGKEANPIIAWERGLIGLDCPCYGRVIVQDYVSYGHDFNDSNLCYDCKLSFLEKAIEELKMLKESHETQD